MHSARPPLFYHRAPSLPRWRRVFEWSLIVTLLSMGAAMIIGVAAIAWNATMGGLTHSDFTSQDKTPLAFILLCLAWWFGLSICLPRKQAPFSASADPRAPARALALSLAEAPKTTFLIAPVWAFILTQLTATHTWPILRLNLSGTEIAQLAHVAKPGDPGNIAKRGTRCFTAARLILSQGIQLDHCLTDDLYKALQPGDGVQIIFLSHGDHLRLAALNRVPAAEMPAVLSLDPDLLALFQRRAARDQRGTRAQ